MSLFLEIEQPGMLVHIGKQTLRTPAKIDVTNMNVNLIKRQLSGDGINGYYFVKTSSNDSLKQSSNLCSSDLSDLHKEISQIKSLIENISVKSRDVDERKEVDSSKQLFVPSVNVKDLHSSVNKHDSSVVGKIDKDKFSTILEELKECS